MAAAMAIAAQIERVVCRAWVKARRAVSSSAGLAEGERLAAPIAPPTESRAVFRASPETPQRRQPGRLHDLGRRALVPHPHAGDPQEARLILLHQRGEHAMVAGPKRGDRGSFVDPHRDAQTSS
jgi:hypothetical protein